MLPARLVGLFIDPHRLDRRQRELLVGIRRYAERVPDWRLVFEPFAVYRPPWPYQGVIASVGHKAARRLQASGLPAVHVGWRAEVVRPVFRVAEDRRQAGRLAAAHLAERGYESFAYFGFGKETASRLERDGFSTWLRRRGRAVADRRIPLTYYFPRQRWDRDLDYIEDWLKRLERPVGIFVATAALAGTLADLADHLRLRIPDDVGLVAAGDEPALCDFGRHPLTSLAFHYRRVGARAAEVLHHLMEGQAPPRATVIIPPTLVPRGSTDTWHAEDPLVARALSYIAQHSAEPLRVADVVAAASLSQRQLSRRLKERRGTTIRQEIALARVEHAQRLLEGSDDSFEAIVRQTGFGSRQSLGRAFLEHVGLSPAEYRGRHGPLQKPDGAQASSL